MDELKRQLKETFATVFSLYLKAANFHWNVEGPDFYQYHELFNKVYDDVYGSIDPLAEHLRAIGTYAPANLKRIAELTQIEDALEPIPALDMVARLHDDNLKVVDSLTKSFAEAEKHNLQGLMNFLAARIEQHNKWGWFLRATKKRGE
jgi:starvation-inducible DNA-binding protein